MVTVVMGLIGKKSYFISYPIKIFIYYYYYYYGDCCAGDNCEFAEVLFY
jgi:hypothetical protein